MKRIFRFILFTFLISCSGFVQAQEVPNLIKEGIQFSKVQNYAGAIEKYKSALTIEPENASANYQMGFALNASGKGKEALPYLEKAVQSNSSKLITGGSYELMGTIYDLLAQPQKAIESYQKGISISPENQSLHYNLGLAFFRNKQYNQAEQSAVNSLKSAPEDAPSMRLYALVTFHQNKRAPALLGLCSFLRMEPNGKSSAEAYSNIRNILQGGVLKVEPGKAAPHVDAENSALNQAITQAVLSVKKRNPAPNDLFAEQLKAIYLSVGAVAAKQNNSDFFHTQLAGFYYKLAQTPHVLTFARLISQGVDRNSAAWIKSHAQEVEKLSGWLNAAK